MRSALAPLLALALVGCAGESDDAPPRPVASPPAPPQLVGAYELVWSDDASGARFTVPDSLIAEIPGCIWARWGWDFAPDGQLTVSNRLLCRAPPDLGRSHGVCQAELSTAVEWRANGLLLPAPISAGGRFVFMERHGQVRDTSTVRCNVRLGRVDATFADVVPGASPNRPSELTLALADGGRIRLRAVSDPEVDYGALIDRLDP